MWKRHFVPVPGPRHRPRRLKHHAFSYMVSENSINVVRWTFFPTHRPARMLREPRKAKTTCSARFTECPWYGMIVIKWPWISSRQFMLTSAWPILHHSFIPSVTLRHVWLTILLLKRTSRKSGRGERIAYDSFLSRVEIVEIVEIWHLELCKKAHLSQFRCQFYDFQI